MILLDNLIIQKYIFLSRDSRCVRGNSNLRHYIQAGYSFGKYLYSIEARSKGGDKGGTLPF